MLETKVSVVIEMWFEIEENIFPMVPQEILSMK
jgi:hypothetical protein